MADMARGAIASPYDQTVAWELNRVPPDERDTPKLTKTQAGYTAVPGRHQCVECWQFILTKDDAKAKGVGRCATVEGIIKGIGTCNHWRQGRYMAEEGGRENPDKLGKIEAGYLERTDGYYCASCLRYSPGGEDEGRCRVVWGRIGAPHCCNNWTDGEPWVPEAGPVEAREARAEVEPPDPGPVDAKLAGLADLART